MTNKPNEVLLGAFRWGPLCMFLLCHFLSLNIIPTIFKMFGINIKSCDSLFMKMHIGILIIIPIIYIIYFYIEARKDILNGMRDKYLAKVEVLCIAGVAALFLFVFEFVPCMVIIFLLNVIMKLGLDIVCLYCAYNLALWLVIWPLCLYRYFGIFGNVRKGNN